MWGRISTKLVATHAQAAGRTVGRTLVKQQAQQVRHKSQQALGASKRSQYLARNGSRTSRNTSRQFRVPGHLQTANARALSVSAEGGGHDSDPAASADGTEVAATTTDDSSSEVALEDGSTEASASGDLESDTEVDISETDDHVLTRSGGSGTVESGSETDSIAFVEDMKPSEVIAQLDRHIVGQNDAKRAVAIALRNRWRRQKLPEEIKREIVPRNMLMIGPTGCGKTEIARRLSQLMDAPFIKVEATKFTEVGFHGRDVDTIIRDLLEQGILLTKKTRKKRLKQQVSEAVETKILDALIGRDSVKSAEHKSYLKFLRDGKLDDQKVDIDVPVAASKGSGQGAAIAIDPSALQNGSFDQIFGRFAKALNTGPAKTSRKNIKIKDVRPLLEEAEMELRLDTDDVVADAIRNVEQNGIVFIDEIDKICTPSGEARFSGDASAEGVQRDLLPLVEGSTISTKHGNVNTDYILFICSGAFHKCKPADMLPELQGRLPIRVELQGLDEDDMFRILTEPEANLVEQHRALLSAEGVKLNIDDDVIRHIAKQSADANKNVENIGARRLYTVLERVMEEYSFEAADMEEGSEITVTVDDVEDSVGELMKQQDLKKFIL